MTTNATSLAAEAAEAIRSANHATIGPGRLTVPEVYSVVADLADVAYRLDQLCRQLARNLTTRAELGGLRLDATTRHDHPADAIATAVEHLHAAATRAELVGRALSECQNTLAPVADTGTCHH